MARFVITVEHVWCKGCRICVDFCPRKVMGVNSAGKAAVLEMDQCTGCMMCEFRCPDLAITLERGA